MSNPSNKHHYLPAFFQKRWAGADDLVCVSWAPHRHVVTERRHPNASGFLPGLYSLSRGDAAERQAIETEFLKDLDTKGSEALAAVVAAGGRPSSVSGSTDWARFIMSLMSRSPARLAALARFIDAGAYVTSPATEARYEAMRGRDWPPTLAAYVEQSLERTFEDEIAKLVMTRLLDSKRLGQALLDLHWTVREFDAEAPTLVMSDDPVDYSNLDGPEALLILPIGPRQAFIAARTPRLVDGLRGIAERTFIKTLNSRTVSRAKALVVAYDEAHRKLIAARFRPDSALPQERRQAAPRTV